MNERLLTRRELLRAGGLLALSAIVTGCDTRTKIVKVDQERIYQEIGLRGDISLVDLRAMPQFNDAPGGFIAYDAEVITPEPLSQTRTVKMLKFAWITNSPDARIVVSDVLLDKVEFAAPRDDKPFPYANFDLFYDFFSKNMGDPNYVIETHLKTATFHFSPDDLTRFKGHQSLY